MSVKEKTNTLEITAPSSKSLTIRAVLISILSETETLILNPSYCNDCLSAINIAKQLGCNVKKEVDGLKIKPPLQITSLPNQINCGESALTLRMLAPILTLFNTSFTLLAQGSLKQRPANFIKSAFEQLGVSFKTDNGFPPIKINGTINKSYAEIDGSISSQFLSGLLITLPKLKTSTTLKVANLVSIPYVDITIDMLNKFGIKIGCNKNYSEFKISGNQTYKCNKLKVEGDWSGGASLLVAGAIKGSCIVNNLQNNTLQADKNIMEALILAGVNVTQKDSTVHIERVNKLKAFNFDAVNCPDLFPVLTALASNCIGISKIKGVGRLKHKESDRAKVLQKEFGKIGIKIQIENDYMLIEGSKINGAETFAHNDHRIAMALALAGINSNGTIIINGAECVNKTYPNFFNDIKKLVEDINIKY